jgi:arylsulfatase A-like enzyme
MLRRLLDSPWPYFSLAGVLLVALVVSLFEIHLPRRPVGSVGDIAHLRERQDLNVVFFLVDTLRADRLSCYGYGRETTPVLDFLAASGVRFAHVQAQSSWTKASMASLWTGLYPRRIGVTRFPDALSPEARTPAEILRDAGFRTGGLFRNGWVANNFGFAQGFDLYVQPRPSATPEKFERRTPSSHPLMGSDWDATESAVEFIRSHGHQRFFLYVHYMDVHQYLYEIESAKFGSDIRDAYDNAVHWTDRNVSAVLGALEGLDLTRKTIVVLASDHGEAFYEHGIEGHARNLYREVTETPLIFILPFRLEPGLVVESPVQNVDVWPTLLDLLGLPPLPQADGRSLLPLMLGAADGGAAPPEFGGPRFAELDQSWGRTDRRPRPLVAVVDGAYKLVRHVKREGGYELYDRSLDPSEQTNVAERHPEVVERLDAHLERYLDREVAFDSPQVELDEMRLGQLRALGYVDLKK